MISGVNKGLGPGALMEADASKKRLKEACQEFEAVLTNTVFKSMRQSIMRAEEPDQAREIFESMMDETLAKEFSKSEGCGLAALLYKQLLPMIAGSGKEEAENQGAAATKSSTRDGAGQAVTGTFRRTG